MADNRKIVKVFLASPGDLQEERRAAKAAIDEFNSTWSESTGYGVQLVGWEDTLPGFGRPQTIINRDLLKCELFIGAMWKKWGTPPDAAGKFTSGFEEEFELSVSRKESEGKPEIVLYFKDIDSDLLTDKGPDLIKVLTFQEKVKEERKVLFKTFKNASDFQGQVRMCVSAYVQRLQEEEKQQRTNDSTPAGPSHSAVRQPSTNNPFGKEGVEFIERFLSKTDDGDENSVTAVDVARLRLLSTAINKSGNDEQVVGAHDANILFSQRHVLSFSSREVSALLQAGLRGFAHENIPLWHWYALQEANSPGALSGNTIFGSVEERVGALGVLRLLGEPLQVDEDALTRELYLRIWFAPETSSKIKVAALKYLGDFGEETDLETVKNEYAKNDFQTASAAVEAFLRINSRINPQAAVAALLETQTENVSDDLVDEIFKRGELDHDVLAKCLSHRSSAVRFAAFKKILSERELDGEFMTSLLTDNNYKLRREVTHALVAQGKNFSVEELKQILVQPAGKSILGGSFADSGELDRFLATEYRRMELSDLEKLKDRDNFYDRAVFFALAERQFDTAGDGLRSDIADFYSADFDAYVSNLAKHIGSDSKSVKDTIGLKSWVTKNFTQAALEIVCLKRDKNDLTLVRDALSKKILHCSPSVVEFLATWGEWQDVPLLIESTNRITSLSGSLLQEVDFKPFEAVAKAIYKIGEAHISDLLLLEMPPQLFSRLVLTLPGQVFDALGDEALNKLLLNDSDEIRKAVALKCVLCLPRVRVSALLNDYASADKWRFYNGIMWLDLGASVPSAIAKKVATKAIDLAWAT